MAGLKKKTKYEKRWGKRQLTVILDPADFARVQDRAASESRKVADMGRVLVLGALDMKTSSPGTVWVAWRDAPRDFVDGLAPHLDQAAAYQIAYELQRRFPS